jgi:hypothetical protein
MRFYTQQHKHYCGIDLHARQMYLCVLDSAGAVLLSLNIDCNPKTFLSAVKLSERTGGSSGMHVHLVLARGSMRAGEHCLRARSRAVHKTAALPGLATCRNAASVSFLSGSRST